MKNVKETSFVVHSFVSVSPLLYIVLSQPINFMTITQIPLMCVINKNSITFWRKKSLQQLEINTSNPLGSV